MDKSPAECVTYPPHSRYRWMAIGSGVLFLLLGWNLISPWLKSGMLNYSEMDVGLLFFMAVALAIALWYLRLALSRVLVSPATVTLTGPLTRSQTITTQQMAGVSVSERGGHAITLLYHPSGRNGLVDPGELASLTLPEMADQEMLLELLEAQVPA